MIGPVNPARSWLVVRFATTILVSAILASSIHHPAIPAEVGSSRGDPRQVEMLYSEDDTLCRPLARLYNKLSHEQPLGHGWEDNYAGLFSAIGLRQPAPLNDALHPFQQTPRQAYYRLQLGDGQHSQLVFVGDTHSGDRGQFRTNVWIFKPGMDIDGRQFFLPGGGVPGRGFEPSKIKVAVLFWWSSYPEGYRWIGLPYYFLKITTPAERAAIEADPERPQPVEGLSPSIAYTIQRPFIFRRSTIFLAEDGFYFLVYAYNHGKIDDVCYFANAATQQRMRSWWESPHKGEQR
jgi:hypothetical protein